MKASIIAVKVHPVAKSFDAVLIVAFGGPQGADDVRPFLANVLRGRRVAPERVKAELAKAGYALAEEHGFLPRQYFLLFSPR